MRITPDLSGPVLRRQGHGFGAQLMTCPELVRGWAESAESVVSRVKGGETVSSQSGCFGVVNVWLNP